MEATVTNWGEHLTADEVACQSILSLEPNGCG